MTEDFYDCLTNHKLVYDIITYLHGHCSKITSFLHQCGHQSTNLKNFWLVTETSAVVGEVGQVPYHNI